MGTSAARRAPTTKAWRLAKSAATRYLSPAAPAPVEVRELVGRYVTALEEAPGPEGGALAAFRPARKLAQNLGEFCRKAQEQGWPNALQAWGLAEIPSEAAAHALAARWLGKGGSLEEAALRPALVRLLAEMLPDGTGSLQPKPAPEAAAVVSRFLAAALAQRLVFDLGEPLEAAADDWHSFAGGLARIHQEIAAVAACRDPAPADWQGLEGWLWVTRGMAGMLGHFGGKSPPA